MSKTTLQERIREGESKDIERFINFTPHYNPMIKHKFIYSKLLLIVNNASYLEVRK